MKDIKSTDNRLNAFYIYGTNSGQEWGSHTQKINWRARQINFTNLYLENEMPIICIIAWLWWVEIHFKCVEIDLVFLMKDAFPLEFSHDVYVN